MSDAPKTTLRLSSDRGRERIMREAADREPGPMPDIMKRMYGKDVAGRAAEMQRFFDRRSEA